MSAKTERPAADVPVSTWLPRLGVVDAVGALTALAIATITFFYPYGRDQASFGYIGREWGLGNVPYQATFEIKPPPIYFTYLVAYRLFGQNLAAIRLFDFFFALVPSALACAYAVTPSEERVPRGRIGVALLVASVVYYFQFDFWNTAQCESFCSMCGVVAACFALRGKSPLRTGVVIGLFSALGVSYKPTVGLIGLGNVLVFAAALATRGGRLRDYVRAAFGLAVGAAMPFVAIFGYFASRHALADMHETLVVTVRQYLLVGRYVHGTRETVRATMSGLLAFQALFSFVFVWLVARTIGLLQGGKLRRALPMLAAVLGIVTSTLAVVAQLKFFIYHWLPTVGFFCLGVVALANDPGGARRSFRRAIAPALCLALVVSGGANTKRYLQHAKTALYWARMGDDEPFVRSFSIAGFYSWYDSREVGRWLSSHGSPDDGLVVRGFEPQIYVASGMRYGGRFFEGVWLTEKRFSTLTERHAKDDYAYFRAHPPRWVVTFTAPTSDIEDPATYVRLGYRRRADVSVFAILERTSSDPLPEECPW